MLPDVGAGLATELDQRRGAVVLGTADDHPRIGGIEVGDQVAGIELDGVQAVVEMNEVRCRQGGIGAVVDAAIVADQQTIGVATDEGPGVLVDVHDRLVVVAQQIDETGGAIDGSVGPPGAQHHIVDIGR